MTGNRERGYCIQGLLNQSCVIIHIDADGMGVYLVGSLLVAVRKVAVVSISSY